MTKWRSDIFEDPMADCFILKISKTTDNGKTGFLIRFTEEAFDKYATQVAEGEAYPFLDIKKVIAND